MSFERLNTASPENYEWAALSQVGVVDLIDDGLSGKSFFVTSAKMLRNAAGEVETIDRMAVQHTFQTLTDHFDFYHSDASYINRCSCPLHAWHAQGTGILITPESLLELGATLESDRLALSLFHIWRTGAQNIIDTADSLILIAQQHGVELPAYLLKDPEAA